MAVSVKVYREISDFQAKIIGSLTLRQLKAVAIFMVPTLAVFALAWFVFKSPPGGWAQWFAVLAVVPTAAYGWLRPMGLDFEKYLGYWRAHSVGRRHFMHALPCPACFDGIEHSAAACTARRPMAWSSQMDLKSKKVRRNVAVFETTH